MCFEPIQDIRQSNNLLFTLASYNLSKCFLLWEYLGVPLLYVQPSAEYIFS